MDNIHAGWLTKSPRQRNNSTLWKIFRSRWRRRYFVLYAPPASTMFPGMCSAVLDYYDNERLIFKKGTIDLTNCVEVRAHPESDFCQHVFSLRTKHRGHDRTYYLVSETEADMKHWVDCLRAVLFIDGGFERGRDTFFRANNSSVSSYPGERYIQVPEHSVSSSSSYDASASSTPSSPLQLGVSSYPMALTVPMVPESADDEQESYILLEDCFSGPPSSARTSVPIYSMPQHKQPAKVDNRPRQPCRLAELSANAAYPDTVDYCNETELGRLHNPTAGGHGTVQLSQPQLSRLCGITPCSFMPGDDIVLPTKKPGLSDSSSSDSDSDFETVARSHGRPRYSDTVHYLDLDHSASAASDSATNGSSASRLPFTAAEQTEYREIDELKTKALQVTRCTLESERRFSSDKPADL